MNTLFECKNCQTTKGLIETHLTDEGWIFLCDDCAEENHRMELQADQLAALPSCETRQQIIDNAETTMQLVNALRAHDQHPCPSCDRLKFLQAAGLTREQAAAYIALIPQTFQEVA
jgi:hypothetical protein